MLGKSTRRGPVIVFIGLHCLIGPLAAPAPAQAEQTRQVTIVQDLAPLGLVSGQTLRYTWANLDDAAPGERVFEPMRIGVRLLAADGSELAQDGATAVGAGRFQIFDFRRGALSPPVAAGTGRLQVRLEVTVVGRSKFPPVVLKRAILETFDDAVEVIDDAGGATTASFGGGNNELILDDTPGNESPDPQGPRIVAAGTDHLIGIARGQTLRVSAVNPLAPGEDGRNDTMLFGVTILDADGRVIAQGAEIALDPGTSHSFDFHRADLPRTGELGTDRLQARVEIRRFFPGFASRFPQGHRDPAPAALELVDTDTGKTMHLRSSKPKEIVVVGSK